MWKEEHKVSDYFSKFLYSLLTLFILFCRYVSKLFSSFSFERQTSYPQAKGKQSWNSSQRILSSKSENMKVQIKMFRILVENMMFSMPKPIFKIDSTHQKTMYLQVSKLEGGRGLLNDLRSFSQSLGCSHLTISSNHLAKIDSYVEFELQTTNLGSGFSAGFSFSSHGSLQHLRKSGIFSEIETSYVYTLLLVSSLLILEQGEINEILFETSRHIVAS